MNDPGSTMTGQVALERYRGARVAIIGSTGFIGRWVARALCELGAELSLPVRNRSTAQTLFAQYRINGTLSELDVCDRARLHDYMQQTAPSVTFNLAAYGVDRSQRDENLMQLTNFTLVKTLCNSVIVHQGEDWPGATLVHAGSALEYGQAGGNLHEETDARPTTLYGRSKLAGTEIVRHLCQTSGLRGVVARLFTVYGPGERPGRLLPSLCEAARNRSPIKLTSGSQRRDFTYVEDVAEGLLHLGLANPTEGHVVNLATGTLTTVRSFVETAARELGLNHEQLLFGAIPNHYTEMEHDAVSLDRLCRLTHWTPQTSVAEGVRQTSARELELSQAEHRSTAHSIG